MSLTSHRPQTAAYLDAALNHLHQGLTTLARGETPNLPPLDDPPPQSPIAELQDTFELNPFERDLLLLCLGATLDPAIAHLCNEITGQNHRCPTLALALTLFAAADWGVFNAAHPLQAWQLIETAADFNPAHAALRLDPRILCFLLGQPALDSHLNGVVDFAPLPPSLPLPYSQQEIVREMCAAWRRAAAPLPLIQLTGPDPASHGLLVEAVATELGFTVGRLAAVNLPATTADLTQLRTHWEREACLSPAILLVDAETLPTENRDRMATIATWLETLHTPVVISSSDRVLSLLRPHLSFGVANPSYREKRELWQVALGDQAPALDDTIAKLATQFALSPGTIKAAGEQVQPLPPAEQHHALVTYCRTHARPKLDDLAQRIQPKASWNDLVMPQAQQALLLQIATQLHHQTQVYHQWGFGRLGKGLGLSSLFYGPSGTGKTLAAEVLAQAFGYDLYRVDLSAVVSKYIGETEKNLRRIFDAATIGGVVLLFDEADALFGKRTQVRDSRDRHANQEVSYLLQRMESYSGLSILTSNFYNALDEAFLRRIRYVVQFPFPDAEQRTEIWRRVFPPQTPKQALKYDCLGQLDITGGNIRSIAMNAAFAAAAQRQPVSMRLIHQAALTEYKKLQRSLPGTMVSAWFS